jgi:hypothetical protein
MKNDKRFHTSPAALAVLLLAVVMLLAFYKGLTANDVENQVVDVDKKTFRYPIATLVVVAMVAMFGYVIWTVLRANQGESNSVPPTKESSAGDKSPRSGGNL